EKKLKPVLFYAALDYGDAVDHAVLEIHGPERSDSPLRALTLTAQALDQPIAWDLRDEQGRLVKAANGYYYLLKIYDHEGHFDSTRPRFFNVVGDTLLEASKPDYAQGG